MGFNDLPEIDQASKNEDESSSYFRLHFSQKNGFIVSVPTDKGCDFVVELIFENKSTNWRFPVQIKSVENPVFIAERTVLSYSFDVGSLHYMVKAIPPVGLLLLYWPENTTLYYGFAEELYGAILEKREGKLEWKEQDKVNIHIPVANVINRQTILDIYKFIVTRHQNSNDKSLLLHPRETNCNCHMRYEGNGNMLPVDSVRLLRESGMDMYFNNEIPKLSELLDQTQIKDLKSDSRLALLAGLTYWRKGMPVDATYYLEKSLSIPSMIEEDREHAKWTKMHLDMLLGKLSLSDYNQRLISLLNELPDDDEPRRLRYDLCIARNNVEQLKPSRMNEIFDMANLFSQLNLRIAMATLPAETKIHYYLENVTNLSQLLIISDAIWGWKVAEDKKAGRNVDIELLFEIDRFAQKLTEEVEYVFQCLKPLSQNYGHTIMVAQCFEAHLAFQIMMDLNNLRHKFRKIDFHSEKYKKRLAQQVAYGKEALQVFLKHSFYENAFNVSLMLLEINEISNKFDVGVDLDVILISEQADWLQRELNVKSRSLKSRELLAKYDEE